MRQLFITTSFSFLSYQNIFSLYLAFSFILNGLRRQKNITIRKLEYSLKILIFLLKDAQWNQIINYEQLNSNILNKNIELSRSFHEITAVLMLSKDVKSTIRTVVILIKASFNEEWNQAKWNTKANTASSNPSISYISWLWINYCCHVKLATGASGLEGVRIFIWSTFKKRSTFFGFEDLVVDDFDGIEVEAEPYFDVEAYNHVAVDKDYS